MESSNDLTPKDLFSHQKKLITNKKDEEIGFNSPIIAKHFEVFKTNRNFQNFEKEERYPLTKINQTHYQRGHSLGENLDTNKEKIIDFDTYKKQNSEKKKNYKNFENSDVNVNEFKLEENLNGKKNINNENFSKINLVDFLTPKYKTRNSLFDSIKKDSLENLKQKEKFKNLLIKKVGVDKFKEVFIYLTENSIKRIDKNDEKLISILLNKNLDCVVFFQFLIDEN